MHFAHAGSEHAMGAAASCVPLYAVMGLVVVAFVAGAAFYALMNKPKKSRTHNEDQ